MKISNKRSCRKLQNNFTFTINCKFTTIAGLENNHSFKVKHTEIINAEQTLYLEYILVLLGMVVICVQWRSIAPYELSCVCCPV